MEIPKVLQDDLNKKAKLFFRNMKKTCKICKGFGYVTKETDDTTFNDCPGCTGRFTKFRSYLDCNVPSDYLHLTLNDVRQVYSDECFQGYTALLHNITKMVGKYNVLFHRSQEGFTYGITTAGMLLIKRLIDENHSANVVEMSALFDCFFNFNSGDTETNVRRSRLLEFYSTVPVLMIDGLGSESNKDTHGFAYQKLAAFIQTRRMKDRFTIICCDLSMEDIGKRYDSQIVSLLKTSYLGFKITCKEDKQKTSATMKFEKEFPDLSAISHNLSGGTKKIVKVAKKGSGDGQRQD